MTIYNEQLIVAGSFTRAGDVPCNGLAAWDGHQWTALSGAVPDAGHTGMVYTLAVYNGDLIAAGHLTDLQPGTTLANIARWNGQQWQSLGTGVTGTVCSMMPFDGDLVVTGYFITAGDKMSAYLASWGPHYPGDLNADSHVDVTDLLTLAQSFGKTLGTPGYNPAADKPLTNPNGTRCRSPAPAHPPRVPHRCRPSPRSFAGQHNTHLHHLPQRSTALASVTS